MTTEMSMAAPNPQWNARAGHSSSNNNNNHDNNNNNNNNEPGTRQELAHVVPVSEVSFANNDHRGDIPNSNTWKSTSSTSSSSTDPIQNGRTGQRREGGKKRKGTQDDNDDDEEEDDDDEDPDPAAEVSLSTTDEVSPSNPADTKKHAPPPPPVLETIARPLPRPQRHATKGQEFAAANTSNNNNNNNISPRSIDNVHSLEAGASAAASHSSGGSIHSLPTMIEGEGNDIMMMKGGGGGGADEDPPDAGMFLPDAASLPPGWSLSAASPAPPRSRKSSSRTAARRHTRTLSDGVPPHHTLMTSLPPHSSYSSAAAAPHVPLLSYGPYGYPTTGAAPPPPSSSPLSYPGPYVPAPHQPVASGRGGGGGEGRSRTPPTPESSTKVPLLSGHYSLGSLPEAGVSATTPLYSYSYDGNRNDYMGSGSMLPPYYHHQHQQHQQVHSERIMRHAETADNALPPHQYYQPHHHQQQQQQHHHYSERPSRRRSKHRKAKSSGPAFPAPAGYGAFWAPPTVDETGPTAAAAKTAGAPPVSAARTSGTSTVPQSPRRTQHVRNGSFDARNEILGLTSSLRGGISPRTTQTKSAGGGGGGGGSYSEPPTPPRLPTTPINSFAKTTGGTDMLYTWSPATPASTGGGDAVDLGFLQHKRRESTRNRHMRQHSAQFYVEDCKGEEQMPRCRDVFFSLLFVFHLFFIVYVGNLYAKEALKVHPIEEYNPSVTIYYNNLLYVASISGAFAIVLSTALLGVMTMFARHFVQVALVVVITLSFMWGTIGVGLSAKNVVPVTGIIALALSVAYAFIVWDRIPFASANLSTALSAIRTYPGMVGVAFLAQALALGWTIYFCVVVMGVIDAIREGKLRVSHQTTIAIYVAFGLSYYWTFQVFLNIVQVSTAAVVGHWWHHPEETGLVQKKALKTIFFGLGSICFGSLFMGPVRLIRQVAVFFRPAPDEASLLCLQECLLCIQTCITSIVNTLALHFNPWAFTYVGLYGYGFLDAGRHATELFEKRGWTVIVSDDLVPNVLLMTSLVLGGVTGCFGFLLQQVDGLHILNIREPHIVGFWLGTGVGLVLTSVLFGVISSSVNAVLVCFAGSPVDFEANHPELSTEMRTAWREVWPGALDMIDMRFAAGAASLPSGQVTDETYPLMGPGSLPQIPVQSMV